MEAPFDATSWNGITGAIYAGFGSSELFWIALCYACVLVAVVAGWRHEDHAYKEAENGKH
jgi:hypothetical protein